MVLGVIYGSYAAIRFSQTRQQFVASLAKYLRALAGIICPKGHITLANSQPVNNEWQVFMTTFVSLLATQDRIFLTLKNDNMLNILTSLPPH